MAEVDHGVASALYVLRGTGEHEPTFECVCGEVFWDKDWEGAGAQFDQHLDESAPTPSSKEGGAHE